MLNHPPANDHDTVQSTERISMFHTWTNQLVINQNYPFRTYWRVSAHGLFTKPLGFYSDPVNLAEVMGVTAADFAQTKPTITSHYTLEAPASPKPLITWTVIPGAVRYEIEFLTQPPENPNSTEPSKYRLKAVSDAFTNGYQPDFTEFGLHQLYWRVRALDYDDNPLGVFSDAAQVVVDFSLPPLNKPIPAADLNKDGRPAPLYPVYSWYPLHGAAAYEVELTAAPPENPNGIEPSNYRLWSKRVTTLDCYDEQPRIIPGSYYWRVRALDAKGQPLGVYSDAVHFTVDLSKGNYAATFGDSITHGGGAISYSPADWEYSYQTYLDFPVVNLGRSGDTSESMLARFDHDVLPFRPKYLIIMGGTNSLRGGTPASSVIRDLAAIRDKATRNGIRPIFLTLPPINPAAIDRAFQEGTVTNWQEEFAAVNNFIRTQRYFIDIAPYFADGTGELADHYAIDGLHLDIEGKKLMAQIINANWARVTR